MVRIKIKIGIVKTNLTTFYIFVIEVKSHKTEYDNSMKKCTLARPTSAILCFLKDIGFELFSCFFSFSVRVGDECDVEVVVVDKSLSSETEGNEFFLFGFDCKDTSLIDLGMVPYVFWRICSSSSEK